MAPRASHDRILKVASDLFYRQGYRATGINQVIAESGVAKATFYDHFPSKDDLLVEYVRATSQQEIADLRGAVPVRASARERFFAPLGILKPWFESTDFRGCPFQNIASEAPAEDPRVVEIARRHRENVRALFRELAFDLLQERRDLKALKPDALADTYLVLFEGAIALAVAYRDCWPVEQARTTLEVLLQRK